MQINVYLRPPLNAIYRISVNKTNHAICWIVIYPVDSVIHVSNNLGQFSWNVDGILLWIGLDIFFKMCVFLSLGLPLIRSNL